jgi:hypothetical protein
MEVDRRFGETSMDQEAMASDDLQMMTWKETDVA